MEPYDRDDFACAGPNGEKVQFGPFYRPLDRDQTMSKRQSDGAVRLVWSRTIEIKIPFGPVLGTKGRSGKSGKNVVNFGYLLAIIS